MNVIKGYLADAGYQSLENIKIVRETGARFYVSRKTRRAQAEQELNEQIKKGTQEREYFCMDNRKLDLASRNSNGTISIRTNPDFCKGCKRTHQCSFYGKKRPDVLDDEDRNIYIEYLERWLCKQSNQKVNVKIQIPTIGK